MSPTNIVLLLFGLGTFARGVYSLMTQDIEEDNERMEGAAAIRHGVILIVLGIAFVSHAIFEWRLVNDLVAWVRRHE